MTTENNVSNSNETQDTQEQGNVSEAEFRQVVQALHENGLKALRFKFEDEQVDGQVLNHEVYGPIFTFKIETKDGGKYATGFFMRELLHTFQNNEDPALWMSSFFFELMDGNEGKDKLLPMPPQSEDEAKALIDNVIVPYCAKTLREEFPDEQVYVDLDLHEEHGPVLEAGFTGITDGNNICALPLHVLIAHFLLNRDPAEPMIQGLYRIREEHGLEA
ncbi:hypothetical protein I8J29_00015 [Paenibacillus sp. MWE-103]|uniref:Uncharacterized protein n=1 Tax=Paenibacillus artemisiicola TaxID=1172618 RepID=A0ABS3W2L5_9BACL|nr:hypothetical protein [Paenibacillus artemisiicola]MBO7742557.1 hypothetical protein [Paenibacillus artemisiicola]